MPSVTNSTKSVSPWSETVIASSNTWQQLSATSQYCQRIPISAPTALNTVGKVNSGNILIKWGLSSAPSGGTAQSGGVTLQPTQNGITYILCADPSLVWIYGTSGDAVEWGPEL